MTRLIAPARHPFTAAHISHPSGERTLCGKPLAGDELWQEVETGPVCKACAYVAAKEKP